MILKLPIKLSAETKIQAKNAKLFHIREKRRVTGTITPVLLVKSDGQVNRRLFITLIWIKTGTPCYLELHASPVFDKQDRLKYIIEQGIDITGHKVTNDLIKKSEEKYRLLAEGTDAVLWEYDILSDNWTYVALQVEQILGYKPEEWTDYEFWLDRIHPDEQIKIGTYCKECTSQGESHKLEYRFLAKNGSYVWLRDVVNVEIDHDKPVKLRGLLLILPITKSWKS